MSDAQSTGAFDAVDDEKPEADRSEQERLDLEESEDPEAPAAPATPDGSRIDADPADVFEQSVEVPADDDYLDEEE